MIAFGEYSGELRELIHLLKYGATYPAAAFLAGKMAEALGPFHSMIPQPLLITAVPLHGNKQRSRGFNQSRLIATGLARILRGRKWQVKENYLLLSRKRATKSQSELNLRQRRANLRGVFAPGANIAAANDAHVLLVDDIVTTAATARQCAKVLVKNGAASVWVAAAARSQREDVATWDSNPAAAGVSQ